MAKDRIKRHLELPEHRIVHRTVTCAPSADVTIVDEIRFEGLALDGDVAATHEDIEDEGQSVDLVEEFGPGGPKTGLAQTGDTNKILPIACLAAVAALAATLAALCGKRHDRVGGEAEGEEKKGEFGRGEQQERMSLQ